MKQIEADNIMAEMQTIATAFRTASLATAMDEVGMIIQEGFLDNFSRESGPEGGWQAIQPRGRSAARPGTTDTILADSGALLAAASGDHTASIRRVMDGNRTVEVGVDKSVKQGGIPGAAAHNFGFRYANSTLPQREWLYATDTVLDKATKKLADLAMTVFFA